MNEKALTEGFASFFHRESGQRGTKTNMAGELWRICTKKTVNSVKVNEFFRELEICREKGLRKCGVRA